MQESMQEWEWEDTDHQFSRMIDLNNKKKMIFLPQVSSHHQQLYNFDNSYGYGDMLFSDINIPTLQTDNKNILNANDEISSFYYVDYDHHYINNHYQYSTVPSMESKLSSVDYDTVKQQHKKENLCSSTKKRGQSENDHQWKSNKNNKKKRAVVCCDQEQAHQEYQFLKHANKEVQRAPTRRSQKLADKITALQKLVSPYGKTDTASVLFEASIFIKVLLDQIQKELDVPNKGLGLVPIALAQKFVEEGLTEEDRFGQYCSFGEI